MSRERDHVRFSEAIRIEIARKEVLMFRRFGIPYEANLKLGDRPVPEGFELVPIRQELLRFSNN